jgi:GT2 family glycosyltransferase
MSLPRVALVYLTYNTPDSAVEIPRCFESLTHINYPLDRVEIICVENPSRHGASWPMIERDWVPRGGKDGFPPITWIHKNEKDVGYAGACNVGAKIAIERGCDFMYLLNQDATVHPDFLQEAIATAAHRPKAAFIQSLMLIGQNQNLVNSMGNQYHFLGYGYSGGYGWSRARAEATLAEEAPKTGNEIPYCSGGALLVRLDFVRQYGLYDAPFYMYHEDTDATFQARLRGHHVIIEPKSIVYHYYEFSKNLKKFYWIERNRYMILLTYYKVATLLLLALPFFVVEIGTFFLSLYAGWWKERVRAWVFFWRPSTWAWVWRRRRRVMRERMVGDRELLRLACSRILFKEETIHVDGQDGSDKSMGFGSWIVNKFANPLLEATWNVIYALIRW